jgi:hypothetical protein
MNIPPFAPLSVPATTLAVTWTWPRLVSETFGRNPRTSFFYLEPRGKLLESCLGQDIFYQWEHLPFLEADVLLQCFSDTLQCLWTHALASHLVAEVHDEAPDASMLGEHQYHRPLIRLTTVARQHR